ncbi:MAG: HAMP domain-containing histidine kinase [Lentisphaeraceae bacterium]|nr:HAMP domain-containing histidine kinase [Lentisphaeraceae bacterium]
MNKLFGVDIEEEYKEFLYIASHDLRSHMRHIKEFSRLLVEDVGELSEDGRDYEHFLSESVKQLDNKFSALVEVSRINTTSEQLVEEDLKELINMAIQAVKVKYLLKPTIMGSWPKIKVYTRIFHKMLCEIVENTAKFSDKDCVNVLISCEQKGSQIIIFIEDDGPGVPEERLEDVFNLFKKLSIDDNSTGAGLTYARKVVRKHGGDITLSNRQPSGLSLRISLPESLIIS